MKFKLKWSFIITTITMSILLIGQYDVKLSMSMIHLYIIGSIIMFISIYYSLVISENESNKK